VVGAVHPSRPSNRAATRGRATRSGRREIRSCWVSPASHFLPSGSPVIGAEKTPRGVIHSVPPWSSGRAARSGLDRCQFRARWVPSPRRGGLGGIRLIQGGTAMKHRAVAGSLAALSASALVFVVAPTAPAQQEQDVCADFNAQEDAQAALDADPGLAQRQPLIDIDMDGIACEDLPRRGSPAATPTRGTPRQTG
jgi:hypothetical protein